MTISTYEKVRSIFRENVPAAAAYTQLRHTFSAEAVRGAVGNLRTDEATMHHAYKQTWAAKDAAYALIVGLMLAADQGERAAEAAADFTNRDFDLKALLMPPTSQPRRIYYTTEQPDAYTVSIAPERVLGTAPDMTLYLFSEADAQMFTGRTGQTLKTLHKF